MSPRFWIALTIGVTVATSCGSGSPSAPSKSEGGGSSIGGGALSGTIVNAIDGQPLAGITVKVGSQRAVSSSNGDFSFDNLPPGTQAEVLSAASVIERRTTVLIPSSSPKREALIPSDFDLGAFDQMFRGNDRLERWTTPPALVVLTTVMNYESGLASGDHAYHATSEQLSDDETNLMVSQLTTALQVLSGNTFSQFASVERESASSGAKVDTFRAGKIVVGRYNGIQGILNTIGFGTWATDENGQVAAGAVYLDKDFDKNSAAQRRLLRTHELGHALGYNHVTSRVSIMNPAIGPDVTTFDRQGCIIAFQRMPGSQSPDSDPSAPTAHPGGGLFTVASVWNKVLP
jgi:Carboxypeptidase regulatory-like domain/Matrixin